MASFDFEAKLTKGDVTTTGLSVVWPDKKALLVREVKAEGLVAMYNAAQENDASKILTGDTIVAVNGVTEDPSAMLKEVADKSNLDCQVKRASPEVRGGMYYNLELKKTADCKKTGLTVRWPDEKSLIIKAFLEEGLVPQWIKANPDADIKPQLGDAIIEVNSVGGTHAELLDMLGKNDDLKLTIFRAPPPPAEQPTVQPAEQPAEAPKEPAPQAEQPEPAKEEPAPEEANAAAPAEEPAQEPAAEPAAEPKNEGENVIEMEPGERDASTQEKKTCGCF